MQNAADRADESFGTIVSDLISLVEHVQDSIRLIDGAIAREISIGEPDTSNVIVLDDVTPQYLKASHALNSCSASLDDALQSLLGARPPILQSAHGQSHPAAVPNQPYRAVREHRSAETVACRFHTG